MHFKIKNRCEAVCVKIIGKITREKYIFESCFMVHFVNNLRGYQRTGASALPADIYSLTEQFKCPFDIVACNCL